MSVKTGQAQYGQNWELNCNVSAALTYTCGSLQANSSGHWIESQCQSWALATTNLQVIDASNGVVVASQSCGYFNDSSIKRTNGLYGYYNVKVWGGVDANGMIRNCTSGCSVKNF